MRAKRTGTGRRFAIATIAALVLHLLVVPPLAWLLPAEGGAGARRALSLSLYDAAVRDRPVYEPAVPIPEGQVVDAPPVEDARPEPDPEARFLSEAGQTVEEETRAAVRVAGAHRVSGRTGAPGAHTGGRPRSGVLGPPGRGVGTGDEDSMPSEFQIITPSPASGEGAGSGPGEEMVAPPGSEDMALTVSPSSPHPSARTGSETGESSPLPAGDLLVPTLEVLAGAVEGTAMDRLEGVEVGSATSLSTRPFNHASFYRRVRDQVAQYWNPAGAFALHDPHGRHYGYRDRETLVLVTLDCTGHLVTTSLLEDSGARFLDEEAVSAIEQGAPFYNPPRELCDERRDLITFTFGFYVETDDGPVLRVRVGR